MKYCIIIFIICGFLSCNTENNIIQPLVKEKSVLFLFGMHGNTIGDETFYAKTSDTIVINKLTNQLKLPVEERNLHINGAVARGDGGYNHNRDWHYVPDKWEVAEVSIELCDGNPKYVTRDILKGDTMACFCPWASYVISKVETVIP